MRRLLALSLLLALSVSAAPKKSPPRIAPEEVGHPIALFLSSLSKDGARSVTFKATAVGTRFFFEESTGVTVYRFADGHYVKETFLRGAKLKSAIRKYPATKVTGLP
jgi:hypothetical protein